MNLEKRCADLEAAYQSVTAKALDLSAELHRTKQRLEEALEAARPMSMVERGRFRAMEQCFDFALAEIKALRIENESLKRCK